MRNFISISVIFAATIVLGSCASGGSLEKILDEILPQNTKVRLMATCTPLMGPAVGLFFSQTLPTEKEILDHSGEGKWIRSTSLNHFADADRQEYQGVVGVGATILDGKECLRDISGQAQEILFGNKPGLYFRSRNRQIVAVMFDKPRGHGVLFVQAP